MRQTVEDALQDLNPDALFMDGLDSAIIGWGGQYTKTPWSSTTRTKSSTT